MFVRTPHISGIGKSCSNTTPLTTKQLEIINGMLLGDGSVLIPKTCITPVLGYTTTEPEMANHIVEVLQPLMPPIQEEPACKRLIEDREINCKTAYRIRSYTDLALIPIIKAWRPSGNKIVPADLKITLITARY